MNAIYNPKGKAGEYAKFAASIFVGCSNGCEYCYLKKGVLAHTMGGDHPKLKKVFVDQEDAISQFKDELIRTSLEIRKNGGIFFTFTSDPCLPETWPVFAECARFAMTMGCPVTILTKCADWLKESSAANLIRMSHAIPNMLCIGFTLTGHDEMEPNAATNEERCEAMEFLHSVGVKTFASVEPVVDPESTKKMIFKTHHYCDLFKVGLMSGGKERMADQEVKDMVSEILKKFLDWNVKSKIMFKESVLKYLDPYMMNVMKIHPNVVDKDFSLLKAVKI